MGIMVIVGLPLSLALRKELDLDMVFGVLGLCLFLLSVNVWRRRVSDWVLGFCCCAFGGFVFTEDLQRGVYFLEDCQEKEKKMFLRRGGVFRRYKILCFCTKRNFHLCA
ncbi:unnamed protein product [Cuscuta epithymum]|uniref:Uncharacterized protein n=1 Tax=Cuscuta epithymum TaxID=186058 RepID=A0AAV0DP31_9ASTE|nr:unnamed protein product [Cuscuta epithymum]